MKQNNWRIQMKKWFTFTLSFVLCLTLLSPVFVSADGNTITIRTQDDLKELAMNCRLDTWSRDKTVVLEADITLDENATSFLPIPSFGGTFDGNDHIISGFKMDGKQARIGLFDTLQSSAIVKNLSVEGQVIPSGNRNTIGGIAAINYGHMIGCTFEGTIQGSTSVGGLVGINETTGQMVNCQFQGTVIGEHYVGGIAGQNSGSLVQCENYGDINTTAIEVSSNLSDLSLLRTTESIPAGTDIGGITGFSSGVIQSCVNSGNVGYEHMGYNVGGIAGRQSGYLDGCNNTGTIKGRKDVGGIAGQLEPQVTLRYDEDVLDKLKVELDHLQTLTNQAVADAKTSSDHLSSNMNSLLSDISSAKEAVNGLSGAITDWGNENIGQMNDVSARLSWVISQVSPILDSLNDVASALEDTSNLLGQIADGVAGTGEQGAAAANEIKQASQDAKDAATAAHNSVSHINTAIETAQKILGGELNEDIIQSLKNELNAAKTEIQKIPSHLKSALSHIETAKGHLKEMGDSGTENINRLIELAKNIQDSSASGTDILERISTVITKLTQEPAISFRPIDSQVTSQGNILDGALSQVLQSASGLEGSVSSSSNQLLNDFNAINKQIGAIVDLLEQKLNENDKNTIEDISDEDDGGETSGKIRGSKNNGQINGDVNVAGIVGSLSIEYDFDPEDDLTEEGSRSLDFQCKTLAVVVKCTNDGSVLAKKNYAGGIVGRMDLGAVKICESYGSVESTSGDYVGGIAGLSRSTIRQCYAKCTLSGKEYIGGIIGLGEKDCVVSDCYTLVEIPKANSYFGAISGTETGTFAENYYVSDTLAGLGRISYAGKAAPIEFSALSQKDDMPEKMTQFTLRFMVEDDEIESKSFSYGDSFGGDIFPDVPVKDGSYVKWDTEDLTSLHFDKTITAQYERYVLALASKNTRDSGRSIFLMDGHFDDKAELSAVMEENTGLIHGKKAKEVWKLSCSDSNQESYTIRYLSPKEKTDGYVVYVREDGKWQKADCTTFGSYLVFSVSNPEVEVAVVSSASIWIQCTGLIVLVLFLIGICEMLIHQYNKKKHLPDEHLLKKIQRKWLKKSSKSARHHSIFKSNRWYKIKTHKKHKITMTFVIVALVMTAILLLNTIGTSHASAILQHFASQEEYALDMEVNTELDGHLNYTEVAMTKTQVEGHSVTGIETDGMTLYYANDAIIMENGKAYQMDVLHPDYTAIFAKVTDLYQKLSFSVKKQDSHTIYYLVAEGNNAKSLLSILLPGKEDYLSEAQKISVELTVANKEVESLTFCSDGTLHDPDKTPYHLSATMKPRPLEQAYVIPDVVKETIISNQIETQTPITDDLFRLISAWSQLKQEESFDADFNFKVQCGSIALDDQMQYGQLKTGNVSIQSLRKKDTVIYYSDGVFYDQKGLSLAMDGNENIHRAKLLQILYQVCENGEFACIDTGNNSWLYTMTLDEEAMKKIAYTAVPEMESMDIALPSGSIQITLKDTSIQEINLNCNGELGNIAPVTLSTKLTFNHDGKIDVPEAVKRQVLNQSGEENGK